jgi:hypothetical protein
MMMAVTPIDCWTSVGFGAFFLLVLSRFFTLYCIKKQK